MEFQWKVETNLRQISGHHEISAGSLHASSSFSSEILQKVSGKTVVSSDKDTRIFMNGYQTWTVCPEYTDQDRIRGMHRIPKKLIEAYSFDRYGDYHFAEYPYKKGITHGFSWCYFRDGRKYRLYASLNEEPGYTMFRYDASDQILTIERDCRGVKAEGTYDLFDLFYAEGSEEEVFNAWFDAMDIHPRTREKLYGYSSWYNRYQDISDRSIEEDLSGCEKILKRGDLFQIDDGWEPFVGDWLQADENKFPRGMKKAADDIHEAGFRAGLWLAPFVAEEKSDLYRNHQDWFLKVDGKNWKDGCNWSGFYSLDIDQPQVQEYLRKVFHLVLDEWGYDLVKLDFLYGAAPFGSEKESRAGRMYRAMRFLRDLCGDKLILGCGVPVMPAFGLADYCRISCDVSLDWDDKFYMRAFHRERTSTKNAVADIMSRRQLNERAYMSDPDVFFLRNKNIKLKTEDKHDLAVLDALLGGVFLTSDNPSEYSAEMKEQYRNLRSLSEEAQDVQAHYDHGIVIDYMRNGKKERVWLFHNHK